MVSSYGAVEEGGGRSSPSTAAPPQPPPQSPYTYVSFQDIERDGDDVGEGQTYRLGADHQPAEGAEKSDTWLQVPTWIVASSALFLVAFTATVTTVAMTLPAARQSAKTGALPPTAAAELTAVVTNEYTGKYPNAVKFPYPFLKDALLMEPYRLATVTLRDVPDDCGVNWSLTSYDDAAVVWEGTTIPAAVTAADADTDADADADTAAAADADADADQLPRDVFTVTPTAPGKYHLTVVEKCGTEQTVTRVLEKAVWVKYVRRELMSLTEQDKAEFLDAFRTLWGVNTRDGMAKYGDGYRSIAHFSMVHNDGGGNGVCDEFHAGIGFVNTHLYLGMYLEQVMRLVNPRVSLHYMEYSKYFESAGFDAHKENQMDGGTWTELMTEVRHPRNTDRYLAPSSTSFP